VALSLEEAQALRAAWLAALQAVATGQSYTIAGRTLTRVDAKYIQQQFSKYDQSVDQLAAGKTAGIPIFRVMPRDV
jgi:hypothetical protein